MLSSVPLDPTRHVLDALDSGEPELDHWLRDHATGSDVRGMTRTFGWIQGDTAEVVGYYALMAHVIRRDALPRSLGRGTPREIPAVLLAKLALDRRLHGQGLGGALLGDASERACMAARNVGAKFLVVDALHERTAAFYEHHGFKRIPATLRLLQKMSAIAKAIDDA
jgi:GNAT superfamily N-acetyltransferase